MLGKGGFQRVARERDALVDQTRDAPGGRRIDEHRTPLCAELSKLGGAVRFVAQRALSLRNGSAPGRRGSSDARIARNGSAANQRDSGGDESAHATPTGRTTAFAISPKTEREQ